MLLPGDTNGLLAGQSFANDYHVSFFLKGGPKPLPHYRMIIHDDDPDPGHRGLTLTGGFRSSENRKER